MNKKLGVLLAAVLFSVFAVILVSAGILSTPGLRVNDLFFQRGRSVDRRIVILGIDEKSIHYFGPIQTWTRDIYADALHLLYAEDEQPMAVGIDVLFAGEGEEETDLYLAEACREYENVVVAQNVVVGSEISDDAEGVYLNDYSVLQVEEPYEELKMNTLQGFWNTMADTDGTIRHGILQFELADGSRLDSFSYKLYQLYAKKAGLPADLHDILPMNERFQWYIPFSSAPGGYEVYSLVDLFTGELTGEDLSDCIVLIGPYTEGMNDGYFTSIDHSRKMYGVEIHANMIDSMIDGLFKKQVPSWIFLLLLFCVTFIAACLFHRLKISYALVWWVYLCLGYTGLVLWLYHIGYIMPVLYVPLFVTVLFLAEIGIKYGKEVLEKRKIVHTFKRYVAPQVVDEIFKMDAGQLGLGGRMTEIACLFVDIRGFTSMSEQLEPTEVVDILNRYLHLTNDCIIKNEGTLDKFIGDATMAIYNAPLPLEDYIYKAVKTAWDMVEGAERLKEELENSCGRSVSFGVGVHCGSAIVGNIGTKMRMDYTAIGDTVNTAARLESNAKAGQILISRAVKEALGDRIRTNSLGSITLKGKANAFDIYEVTAVNGQEVKAWS
ncbi:adenylate/guanylate cyclase domain-containing protein [Anaerolentibacter hominis]|uniref:adenylate/guanylate cyclase domain-containing protein n=1 Tax=Anaerolentibacter hominis TaxID=3079009 RepID=UPI0031B80CA1